MTDRLDDALHALGGRAAWPATPDLAPAVVERLRMERPGRRPLGHRRPLGRAVLLAAALTVAIAATVAALVAGLPGLRIVPVATIPPGPSLAADLALGDRAAPSEPQPFWVSELERADEMYVARGGDVVTLVYASSDDLPELRSGIGLLAQRITGRLDDAMVEKLVEEVGARVVPVTVGDADGFWIEGAPHLVRYLAPSGGQRAEMTRLAGDTLVWQKGDVLYRLESAMSLEATLRLAESVEEPGTGGP